jgi:endonuclease YncB( thermonuclease family)
MDRPIAAFWGISTVLVAVSVFYGFNAYRYKASTAPIAKLDSGDVVRLAKVLEGDTVIVRKDEQGDAVVRILGIRTFESKIDRDPTSVFGRAAEDAVRRLAADKPLRVLVHNPPKDRAGRTLATLFVDDEDLGLQLVAQGLALVYTPTPFPAMPLYLREQAAARRGKLGLWADPGIAERADALARAWQRQTP